MFRSGLMVLAMLPLASCAAPMMAPMLMQAVQQTAQVAAVSQTSAAAKPAVTAGMVSAKSTVLRASASASGKKLATLKRGDAVEVLSTDGDWYQVAAATRKGPVNGWLSRSVLEVPTAAASTPAQAQAQAPGAVAGAVAAGVLGAALTGATGVPMMGAGIGGYPSAAVPGAPLMALPR